MASLATSRAPTDSRDPLPHACSSRFASRAAPDFSGPGNRVGETAVPGGRPRCAGRPEKALVPASHSSTRHATETAELCEFGWQQLRTRQMESAMRQGPVCEEDGKYLRAANHRHWRRTVRHLIPPEWAPVSPGRQGRVPYEGRDNERKRSIGAPRRHSLRGADVPPLQRTSER